MQAPRDHDPYWTEEVDLFAGAFRYTHGEPRIVRTRVHRSEEPYRLDAGEQEIVPVAEQTGTRIYVHVEPYILVPDIRLTVALSPAAQRSGVIGQVEGVDERGGRRQPVGHGQAWYYPADGTLLIWEAFLDAPFRDAPLGEDAHMRRLWRGVEDYLTMRFPATARLVTPFDDPLFETEEYQAFLRGLGYAPVARAAYGKPR